MERINFLPQQLLQAEIRRRTAILVVITILIGLGLGAGLWSGVRVGHLITSDQLTQKRVLPTPTPTSATSGHAVVSAADAALRITLLNGLGSAAVQWDKVFALLNAITPSDTYLTTSSFSSVGGNLAFKVSGESPSNHSFATFFESLLQDRTITQTKVDGYSFDAKSGRVAFSAEWQVPLAKFTYAAPTPTVILNQ